MRFKRLQGRGIQQNDGCAGDGVVFLETHVKTCQ
jgi:hypothetical protein